MNAGHLSDRTEPWGGLAQDGAQLTASCAESTPTRGSGREERSLACRWPTSPRGRLWLRWGCGRAAATAAFRASALRHVPQAQQHVSGAVQTSRRGLGAVRDGHGRRSAAAWYSGGYALGDAAAREGAIASGDPTAVPLEASVIQIAEARASDLPNPAQDGRLRRLLSARVKGAMRAASGAPRDGRLPAAVPCPREGTVRHPDTARDHKGGGMARRVGAAEEDAAPPVGNDARHTGRARFFLPGTSPNVAQCAPLPMPSAGPSIPVEGPNPVATPPPGHPDGARCEPTDEP